jgi:hypothetical protein
MTTRKFVQALIVTVALCLSATAGRAQDDRFFVMAGGSSLLDKRSFAEPFATTIPYRTNYATGGKVTVGIEMPLKKSKIFGFEGSYGIGDNNLRLINADYSYLPFTGYDMRNNRVSADIIARPPWVYHGGHPYAVVGLEFDRFSPLSSAVSVGDREGFAFEPVARLVGQNTGGANFGGGMDWKLASKVSLRMDVRDHITGSPTLGLPTTAPATTGLPWFPIHGPAHAVEYSIGIVYRFGK